MEQELRRMFENKESEMSVPSTMPSELRSRVGRHRMVTGALVAAAAVALTVGGFAGARSLTNEEALPPAKEDSKADSLAGTWTSTDVYGKTETMVIKGSDKDTYEVTLHDDQPTDAFFEPNENGRYERVVKDVCSGSPATLTGKARLFGATQLAITSPELTCDDGSEPVDAGDLPPLEERLADLTFNHDPQVEILVNAGGNDFASVWSRADAENRIADVDGWITYGDQNGIWARDLTNPDDPSDRVRLSSASGFPVAWSPDGESLLSSLTVQDSDPGNSNDTDLVLLTADGTKTLPTDAGASPSDEAFSADGLQFAYATSSEDPHRSFVWVIDASGGGPRRVHSSDDHIEDPTFSPDGSLIAYFEGGGDHSNRLWVMNADGNGRRILLDREFGHINGLQWSPDGSQLTFSSGGIWVVGADGAGLEQVSPEEVDGINPYWSPDGSHIAYMRNDADSRWRGNLEIIRLEDGTIQSFGDGASGPWTTEVGW